MGFDGTCCVPIHTESSADRPCLARTAARATVDPHRDGGTMGLVNLRQLASATVLSIGLVTIAAGCGGDDRGASGSATEATPAADAAASIGTNPFIPENVNIGDCVSSLPRPGCGSEAGSSGATLLTFGVLTAGLAFIGWRVARGVRQRDRTHETQ
jgi:hypothetical protein